MKVSKFWKIFLITLGCLVLLTVGVFIYTRYSFDIGTPRLDKYSEILNWCDSEKNADMLNIHCKGLLLNISSQGNNESCFDIKIISKNDKLQELTFCEENTQIQYSNEILNYRKLMPTNIDFSYSQKSILGDYALSSIIVNPVEEEYLQSIINADIAELTTLNINNMIRNSVNFCPTAEKLPVYIPKNILEDYATYYTKNVMGEDLKTANIYDLTNSAISLFLPCYTSNDCKYTRFENSFPQVSSQPLHPKLGRTLSNLDYDTLAQLSYLYDNQQVILPTYAPYSTKEETPKITTPEEVFTQIIFNLFSDENTSEEIFCTAYLAISSLKNNGQALVELKQSMQSYLLSELPDSTFPLCYNGVKESNAYDRTGIYIMYKMSIKNDSLKILNRCFNLSNFLQ